MSRPGKMDGSSDLDLEFDPGLDWPPDGAIVHTSSGVAAFYDGPMREGPAGWYLPDGRYARPFDSLGQLLARQWAVNPRMESADE